MSPAEAKKIIAAYLAGRRVSAAEVAQATGILRADQGYAEALARVTRAERGTISACDLFLSRVAEYSELTPADRQRRMPELWRHVRECATCRDALWNVQPWWLEAAAGQVKAGAATLWRTLADQIRVRIDAAGRVFDAGMGPPPLREHLVAATAAPPPEGEPSRQDWELPDPQTGCLIRLTIAAVSGQSAAVGCSLGWSGAEPGQVRIEIRARDTHALLVGGRLSDFEGEPLTLPRGSWVVRLRTTAAGLECTWDVPVTIERQPPPGEV
jgi:hypothetical protein